MYGRVGTCGFVRCGTEPILAMGLAPVSSMTDGTVLGGLIHRVREFVKEN
jgi:hypothetical protein